MSKSREMGEIDQSMIKNLLAKTGRTIDEWLAVAAESGLQNHGEIVTFLKTRHGLTHGYADLVSRQSRSAGAPQSDDLLEAQYSGPKVGLREIYDKVVEAVTGFGTDVKISPKKTYVSLRRSKQFGILQASTNTRVDVGLVLQDHQATARLEAAGSFNAMMTHRVRLQAPADVDDELLAWLELAYWMA